MWMPRVARGWVNSRAKSRSEVASMLLGVGASKLRARAAMVRSRARVAPAMAPEPRGQRFMRLRASVRRGKLCSVILEEGGGPWGKRKGSAGGGGGWGGGGELPADAAALWGREG